MQIKKIYASIFILIISSLYFGCGKFDKDPILKPKNDNNINLIENSIRSLGGPYDFWQNNINTSVVLKMEHKKWSKKYKEDNASLMHLCKIDNKNKISQRFKFDDDEADLKAPFFKRNATFYWHRESEFNKNDPFDNGYKFLTITNYSVDNGFDQFLGSDSIPISNGFFNWQYRDHTFKRVKDFELIKKMIDLGCNF